MISKADSVQFTLSQVQLASAVNAVLRCADRETQRFTLGSVALEFQSGAVVVVATDGRCLATTIVNDSNLPESLIGQRWLIPLAAAKAIAKFPKGDKSKERVCKLQLEANKLSIVWSTVRGAARTVESELADGHYPRWELCFPSTDDKSAGKLCGSAELWLQNIEPARLQLSADGVGFAASADVKPLTVKGNPTAQLCPALVANVLNGLPTDVTVEAVDYGDGKPVAFASQFMSFRALVMPLADN